MCFQGLEAFPLPHLPGGPEVCGQQLAGQRPRKCMLIECFVETRLVRSSYGHSLISLPSQPGEKVYPFPHLLHKEIEAQSGQVTWLRSYCKSIARWP